MASAARKCARTAAGGEEDAEPSPIADGFEAPLFGARVVGQVTTLTLEGEDGPLWLGPVGVASDHAGAWYVATEDSLLQVSHRRCQPGRERAVCGGLEQQQDLAGGGCDWRCDDARGQRRRRRRRWRW